MNVDERQKLDKTLFNTNHLLLRWDIDPFKHISEAGK